MYRARIDLSRSAADSNLDEERVFSRPDRLTVARVTLPAATGRWIYVSPRTETERDRVRERGEGGGREGGKFQMELGTRQMADCVLMSKLKSTAKSRIDRRKEET